ncbi:MAG: hypothetical protein IKT46_02385 [Clostridia bacterium]|nr:hypothetical protein [Clostridia bacterium]
MECFITTTIVGIILCVLGGVNMTGNISSLHWYHRQRVTEDDIHPNAKIVNIKPVAKDGSITITDATNNKTYSGTYKVQQKTPKGTDYEVMIDGIKGYATVAPTEYYDGSEVPTLPINLGEYSLYFTPNN